MKISLLFFPAYNYRPINLLLILQAKNDIRPVGDGVGVEGEGMHGMEGISIMLLPWILLIM
jgi:hypothetical protein